MPKHKKASTNIRKKEVSPKQINRIRTLSHEGKTTNQIQRTLSKEKIGLRRTVLLRYVREFKGKQPQANTAKYTRKKYRKAKKPKRLRGATYQGYQQSYRRRHRKAPSLTIKHVTIYGSQYGKRKQIQLYGRGRELFEAIKDDIIKYAPKQQFLEISADELLSNPDKFLSKEKWDERPRINS